MSYKAWAYGAAHALGIAALLRRRLGPHLLIVCYHGLTRLPSPTGDWLLLPLRRFRAQLDFLQRAYEVLPLDAAVQHLVSGTLDRPSACITFDDGYANNLALGLPELRTRGLPATIFLATGLMGTRRRLWTSELLEALEDPRNALPAALPGGLVPPPSTAAGRAAFVARLKELPAAERRPVIDAIMAQLRHPPSAADDETRFLAWDEIRAGSGTSGISFGAHTVNHEIVSRLDDRELEQEIVGSLEAVAARVAHPSRIFSYPNGTAADFDDRAVGVLRRSGCIGALTTLEGVNLPSADPFTLRRIVVNPDMGMGDFVVRCTGTIERLRRTVKAPE